MTLNIGALLNERYRIVSILGQGGMGAVYRAEDENLHIQVAVKENLFLSDEYTRQFQREALILASLRQPNLPRVIDYFSVEAQGQYLIMDFIEGEDLRQRIERVGTLLEKEVIIVGAYICDALAYLHTRRPAIVHRDIKPGNIKITPEGEVVLVDFGLAKVMLSDQATTTGARAMTPGYSPPEQYGTARTDARSDIYSLGATLYAALTGIIPEDGLARATGKAELTPIRQLQPRIERRLAAVIEKALEVEPENRYQTAEEFKKGLVEAGNLAHFTIPRDLIAPPPSNGDFDKTPAEDGEEAEAAPRFKMKSAPPRKPRRKNWVWAPAAVLVVLVGLAAAFITRPFMIGQALSPTTPTSSNLVEVTITQSPTLTGQAGVVAVEDPVESTLTPTPTTTPITDILTPTPEPVGPPPIVGGADMIAFASDRKGSMQIWTMNADGSNPKQFTDMPSGACQPNWSPDGTKLAFISPCYRKENQNYEDSRIYTVNADGSDLRMLPVSQVGDFDPAWAPDSKKLAFTSLRTGTPHIFVYNFEDLTIHELSDTRYPDIHPVWSPDGKHIAFIRQMPFNHVWVMSDQGVTEFQFSTSGNVIDLWPDWSPDGQVIIFSRSQLDPAIPSLMKLRVEDANTGREVRLPSPDIGDLTPVSQARISPDGKYMIYESWPDGRNHDIYMVDINGENLVRLTTDPGFDFSPTWRPVNP